MSVLFNRTISGIAPVADASRCASSSLPLNLSGLFCLSKKKKNYLVCFHHFGLGLEALFQSFSELFESGLVEFGLN